MTSHNQDKEGMSPAHYWAIGGMFFLILVGLGSCCAIANHEAKGPLIEITTEAPASR